MSDKDRSPTAYLSWELDVECPKCDQLFDMSMNDDEHTIAKAVFGNKWDALKGHVVTCHHCAHEFAIAGIEH